MAAAAVLRGGWQLAEKRPCRLCGATDGDAFTLPLMALLLLRALFVERRTQAASRTPLAPIQSPAPLPVGRGRWSDVRDAPRLCAECSGIWTASRQGAAYAHFASARGDGWHKAMCEEIVATGWVSSQTAAELPGFVRSNPARAFELWCDRHAAFVQFSRFTEQSWACTLRCVDDITRTFALERQLRARLAQITASAALFERFRAAHEAGGGGGAGVPTALCLESDGADGKGKCEVLYKLGTVLVYKQVDSSSLEVKEGEAKLTRGLRSGFVRGLLLQLFECDPSRVLIVTAISGDTDQVLAVLLLATMALLAPGGAAAAALANMRLFCVQSCNERKIDCSAAVEVASTLSGLLSGISGAAMLWLVLRWCRGCDYIPASTLYGTTDVLSAASSAAVAAVVADVCSGSPSVGVVELGPGMCAVLPSPAVVQVLVAAAALLRAAGKRAWLQSGVALRGKLCPGRDAPWTAAAFVDAVSDWMATINQDEYKLLPPSAVGSVACHANVIVWEAGYLQTQEEQWHTTVPAAMQAAVPWLEELKEVHVVVHIVSAVERRTVVLRQVTAVAFMPSDGGRWIRQERSERAPPVRFDVDKTIPEKYRLVDVRSHRCSCKAGCGARCGCKRAEARCGDRCGCGGLCGAGAAAATALPAAGAVVLAAEHAAVSVVEEEDAQEEDQDEAAAAAEGGRERAEQEGGAQARRRRRQGNERDAEEEEEEEEEEVEDEDEEVEDEDEDEDAQNEDELARQRELEEEPEVHDEEGEEEWGM